MPGYREDRRIDAIPRLTAVTKNEASGMTDILRERTYELEREAIAADYRKEHGERSKRPFASLVKDKPKR